MYSNNNHEKLISNLNKWKDNQVISSKEYFERAHAIIDMLNGFMKQTIPIIQPAYFRGQSKSSYKLASTLERKYKQLEVHRYYSEILSILPILESHHGQSLSDNDKRIISIDYFNEKVDNIFSLAANLPMIEYLVFLRHHGYPSPLLDWSYSPYVALYFAIKNSLQSPKDINEMPVVYVFIKSSTGIYGGNDNQSQVLHVDPIIKTTPRHYYQQAVYTFCARTKTETNSFNIVDNNNENSNRKIFFFDSHEDVFNRDNDIGVKNQDYLIKFIIKDDRKQVMEYLNYMNINDYTLFNSTDSLVNWLAESKSIDFHEQEQKINRILIRSEKP